MVLEWLVQKKWFFSEDEERQARMDVAERQSAVNISYKSKVDDVKSKVQGDKSEGAEDEWTIRVP